MTEPRDAIVKDLYGGVWQCNGATWARESGGCTGLTWNELLKTFGPLDVFVWRDQVKDQS